MLFMDGVQYYWLIAIGLLVGIILGVGLAFVSPFSTGDPFVVIPLLAAFCYATISSLIVFFEIWNRFGFIVALVAGIVFPVLLLYWLARIRRLDEAR